VGAWHAFYFPALGQSASNLSEFLSALARLDDRGFREHCAARDFSNWFREVIRDDVLANKTRLIESDESVSRQVALAHITDLVQARYHLDDL
jgi:hypothetical protein